MRTLACALTLLVAVAAAAEEEESSCVSCHEVDIDESLAVPVPEWRESVHATAWVSCDACHGGDPRLEDGDASMSEEAGFLDLPSWTEMTDHCGICHEEIAESYALGRFGRALERGERVPTCATCHMQDGHRIREAVPAEIVTTELCPGCPSISDPEAAVAILEQLGNAEAALLLRIDAVESKGIELSDLRQALGVLHRGFSRALHEFDDESLEAARTVTLPQLSGIGEQLAQLAAEADSRRRFGVFLLLALGLLFSALWMKLRTLD